MAGLKNADDYQKGERFKGAGLLGMVSLIVGVVAIAIFFVVAFSSVNAKTGVEGTAVEYSKRSSMAFSWLFAVVFFLSLAVGGMFWTLLHHATNAGWGTLVRRLMENVGIMIPVMFFLALPLVLEPMGFRNVLWEWMPLRQNAEANADKKAEMEIDAYIAKAKAKAAEAQADLEDLNSKKAAEGELTPGKARFFDDKIAEQQVIVDKLQAKADKPKPELQKYLSLKHFKDKEALLYMKRSFLDENLWLIRFVLYVVVLGGGIFLLRSISIKQDQTGDPKLFTKLRGMSCLLLLPFAVAWTFLVFDWLMALDYAWFSTMWGVYLFAGAALNSMALLILLMTFLRKAGYMTDVITKEHYHIMGKLMHAFVIFWAYIAFSQFFLIWYANITEETKFFLTRNTGFWNTYTILFLVIGHFFVPFLVLLVRYCKTTPWIICAICIWNLIMHFLDIYWIIIADRAPSLTGGELNFLPGMWVFDILAFVGVGGIFIFFLLRALGSASLFPCRDPRLDESLNLVN